MFGLFRKRRSLDLLANDLKPTLESRDETKICSLFDRLIAYRRTHADKVEGLVGWAVLVACELRLACADKYLKWFMDSYPDSVMPVKVEHAMALANSGQPDPATQLAREYLRLIKEKGSLGPRLGEFPNVRLGASKAFLVMTAAYTHMGARSYSGRILKYALRFPLDPAYMALCRTELGQLAEELKDEEPAMLDKRWELFFLKGQDADVLSQLCRERKCEMLAARVDLIEASFRFNSGFRADEEEMFLLVAEGEERSGRTGRLLR